MAHTPAHTPTTLRDRIRAVAPIARAVGNTHARTVLGWLWVWRIIDHRVIGYLLGVSRSRSYSLLARLRRMGLVQSVPVSGTPAHPWMLTPYGAETIVPLLDPDDMAPGPITSIDQVRVAQIPHDLLSQLFALALRTPPPQVLSLIDQRREAAQAEVSYPLPEMIVDMRPAAWYEATGIRIGGAKIPDAMIEYMIDRGSDAYVRLAVETQQTVETPAARERAVATYCQALGDEEIDAVVWASTRPAIPPMYAATASRTLRGWVRTSSRHWVSVPGPGPYRDWMHDRILTMPASEMEAAYYHLALAPR